MRSPRIRLCSNEYRFKDDRCSLHVAFVLEACMILVLLLVSEFFLGA